MVKIIIGILALTFICVSGSFGEERGWRSYNGVIGPRHQGFGPGGALELGPGGFQSFGPGGGQSFGPGGGQSFGPRGGQSFGPGGGQSIGPGGGRSMGPGGGASYGPGGGLSSGPEGGLSFGPGGGLSGGGPSLFPGWGQVNYEDSASGLGWNQSYSTGGAHNNPSPVPAPRYVDPDGNTHSDPLLHSAWQNLEERKQLFQQKKELTNQMFAELDAVNKCVATPGCDYLRIIKEYEANPKASHLVMKALNAQLHALEFEAEVIERVHQLAHPTRENIQKIVHDLNEQINENKQTIQAITDGFSECQAKHDDLDGRGPCKKQTAIYLWANSCSVVRYPCP